LDKWNKERAKNKWMDRKKMNKLKRLQEQKQNKWVKEKEKNELIERAQMNKKGKNHQVNERRNSASE